MIQVSQEGRHWEVSGDILMQTAGGLLEMSKQHAFQSDTLIDFGRVGEVDTVAISLMLEWQRSAKAIGVNIKFVNLPANLLSLTKLYDVEAFIPQAA